MRDNEPWKEIRPLDVATVAATLTLNGMDVAEATRNALQLIETATWGLNGLYRVEGLADGVNHWARVQADRMVQIERQSKLPPDWPDPKAVMMPFETALTLLMPRIKKTACLPYFRQWLAHIQGISSMEAGDVITLLKKGGIPREWYTVARISLPGWREMQKSKHRSTAGKKGAKSKHRRARKK